MSTATIVLTVILAAAIWWVLRIRRATPKIGKDKGRQEVPAKSTAFHAVSIKYQNTACGAARAMAERRILATEAPRLPLPDCNVSDCRCRFVHHADRRSGEDRRSPFRSPIGLGPTGMFEQEKRSGRDRRASESYL